MNDFETGLNFGFHADVLAEPVAPIIEVAISESGLIVVLVTDEHGKKSEYVAPAWDADDFLGTIWDTHHKVAVKHCITREVKRKLAEWDAERLGLQKDPQDAEVKRHSWVDMASVLCIWLAVILLAWMASKTSWGAWLGL
jgi:hypothetical protein